MDFIMNNYLWIGIIGVVLLMALIGFLAEKTNFIIGVDSNNKTKKEKTSRWRKNKKDDAVVAEMAFTPENTDEIVPETVNSFDEDSLQNLNNDSPEILEVVSSDNEEPVIESAPINAGTWNVEPDFSTIDSEPATTVTDTGEDLTVPFGDDVKTPDTSKGETETVEDDDEDIWKF